MGSDNSNSSPAPAPPPWATRPGAPAPAVGLSAGFKWTVAATVAIGGVVFLITRLSESKTGYTLEQYDRLRTGMSYAEVVGVIGKGQGRSSDVEVVDAELAGMNRPVVSAVMVWKNRDGSRIELTFENGRLAAKSQVGLR